MAKKLDKGGAAEEVLKDYFRDLGYFAVRGVRVVVAGQEVTDIDLWIYIRASALHRIRANVDAKNRGVPKALERILWAKGLQNALGFEASIVATTDSRDLVKSYGAQAGVQVLGGQFLQSLIRSRSAPGQDWLTDEQFNARINPDGLDSLQGRWVDRVEVAKSRLASHLDFSGCNSWLDDLGFFLAQIGQRRRVEAAGRCAYLMIAFFLIGLDYRVGQFAFEPQERRIEEMKDGFTLGEGGKRRLTETLQLLRASMPGKVQELSADIADARDGAASVLAEFFSKTDVNRSLFTTANVFERAAFAHDLPPPAMLPAPAKSIFAALLDVLGLDRRLFLVDQWPVAEGREVATEDRSVLTPHVKTPPASGDGAHRRADLPPLGGPVPGRPTPPISPGGQNPPKPR